MQVKKNSPKKTSFPKSSSKNKLASPQKMILNAGSPNKSGGKSFLGPAKDFFNYTPLRQNKSLNCSTPELTSQSINKNLNVQNILARKRSILDQSKLLQTKLKEFKKKINTQKLNVFFDSLYSPNKITRFCDALNKLTVKKNTKNTQTTFFLMLEINLISSNRFKAFYARSLKRKVFKSLKKVLNQTKTALVHYEAQLLVKVFMYWNNLVTYEKSSTSIQTNDSNLEINSMPDFQLDKSNKFEDILDTSGNELYLLAESFYLSFLKHYYALGPWKKYVSGRKYKGRRRRVAKDSYECKLLIKGFNGVYKNFLDCYRRPKVFRRLYLTQKVFSALKNNHEGSVETEIESKYADFISRYRQVVNI